MRRRHARSVDDQGIKLNLGCGYDLREGYVNVDLEEFHGPDLVADVMRLEGIDDHAAQEVLAIDVLEHLNRDSTEAALAEWARVTMPGGVLRIRVPDMRGLSRMILSSTDTLEGAETMAGLLYGTQAYTGDFHQAGFTDLLLASKLSQAGFTDIIFSPKDDWMLDLVARKRGDNEESPRLALSLTDGFFAFEGGGPADRFVLSEQAPIPRILNLTPQALSFTLSGRVACLVGDDATVACEPPGGPTASFSADRAGVDFSITGKCEAGVTELPMQSDSERLTPEDERDLRSLHLRWTGVTASG